MLRIDNRNFTMGTACGEGFNCLIDTLRQSLGVVCNVLHIRSELERRHAGKASHILPGSFLELGAHWRDIVELLGLEISEADRIRIVCVDVNLPGHGDVYPQGNNDNKFTLYIARQNLNHFVPLIPDTGSETLQHLLAEASGASKPASSAASSAMLIPPQNEVTAKTTWTQLLPMLQEIRADAIAQKLLQDVPSLRKWQEMPKPTHAVRDAMMKLGTHWEVPQKKRKGRSVHLQR